MGIVEAVQSGDKLATLIALRDKIAETIEACESGRDMASNSKRLMEVIAEIEIEERAQAEKRKKSKHDIMKGKR